MICYRCEGEVFFGQKACLNCDFPIPENAEVSNLVVRMKDAIVDAIECEDCCTVCRKTLKKALGDLWPGAGPLPAVQKAFATKVEVLVEILRSLPFTTAMDPYVIQKGVMP